MSHRKHGIQNIWIQNNLWKKVKALKKGSKVGCLNFKSIGVKERKDPQVLIQS